MKNKGIHRNMLHFFVFWVILTEKPFDFSLPGVRNGTASAKSRGKKRPLRCEMISSCFDPDSMRDAAAVCLKDLLNEIAVRYAHALPIF